MLAALRLVPGRVVPTQELVELLWGEAEDGGPVDAQRNLRICIHHLRRALVDTGVQIRNRVGDGYWMEYD